MNACPASNYYKVSVRRLFFLLVAINSSCMLYDGETNFVHVDQVTNPEHIANLTFSYRGSGKNYPVRDTFWVAPGENLTFNFSGPMFRVTAEVDGKSVFDEDHNATIWISSDGLTEGAHELKITQYVKSGTRSLADKLNVEMASYTARFVMMIGTYEFTPVIQSINVTDKGVNLLWNSYDRSDFQAYEIRKYSGWDSHFEEWEPHRKFIITDPTQTSFTDTTYVGGTVAYFVTVDKGGKHFLSAQKSVTFNYKVNLRLTPTGNGRARLSWDVHPYHENTRYRNVFQWRGLSETRLAENIPAGQTSVEIDYTTVFGQLSQLSLQMWADTEGDPTTVDRYSVFEYLTTGIRTPPFTNILYNQKENAYYLVQDNGVASDYPRGLFRLDKDLRISDSLTSLTYGHLIKSPDGNRLFILRQTSITELQDVPLAVKQTHDTGVGFNVSNKQLTTATNNNYILYRHSDNVDVLDFTTKTVLLRVPLIGMAHISPDGQYFANGPDLYKFDGTQFTIIGTLPFQDIRFLHFLNSGDRLFIATADKAIVYDHINGSTVTEYDFPTGSSSHPQFNDLTMTYFTRGTGLTLLNINTGEQKVVQVADADGATIEGEYLFSYHGFGLKPYDNE